MATIIVGIAIATASSAQTPQPPYKNPHQPVNRRVEDLLSRMTLDEKVAQLLTVWDQKSKMQTPDGHFSPENASHAFPNGIGGLARPSDKRGVEASNGAAGANQGVTAPFRLS